MPCLLAKKTAARLPAAKGCLLLAVLYFSMVGTLGAQEAGFGDSRVEVVRGSGGTLWGANAANGVTNITTSSAAATQGGFLEAAADDRLPGVTGVRYGEKFSYRVYRLETARSIHGKNTWRF